MPQCNPPDSYNYVSLGRDACARLGVPWTERLVSYYGGSVDIGLSTSRDIAGCLTFAARFWSDPDHQMRIVRYLRLAPARCAHLYDYDTLVVGCEACRTICAVCTPCTRCDDCGALHPQLTAHGCPNCLHCEDVTVCRAGICLECCAEQHGLNCRRCNRHRHGEVLCSNCDGAGCCCRCMYCNGCDSRVSELQCERCDRCEDCGCDCPRRRPRRNAPMVWHAAKRNQYRKIPSKRWLGVEIELDGEENNYDRIANWARKWSASMVSDGSLSEHGIEAVTSPAQGDVFVDMLSEFETAAINGGVGVTRDCGLHVHIDARDFSYYDLRRLIWLYAVLEPALFETQARTRRESTYCRPCGDRYAEALVKGTMPKESKKAVIRGTYGAELSTVGPQSRRDGQSFLERRRYKYDSARYAALNLHSWFFRGTVECRLHSGTARGNKIAAWGALWACILDTAYRMTEREARALYDAHAAVKAKAGYHASSPAVLNYSRRALYWIAPPIAQSYLVRRWSLYGKRHSAWLPGKEQSE